MNTHISRDSLNTDTSSVGSVLYKAYTETILNTDSYLSAYFTGLQEKLFKLNEAINHANAESELKVKDALRDQYVRRIFSVTRGASDNFFEDLQLAGEKLQKLLKNYGLSILYESYATETGLINSLVQDFEKKEFSEAIAAIRGCAELINALKEAQSDFEMAQANFGALTAKQNKAATATELKLELIDDINKRLIDYINGDWVPNKEACTEFALVVKQIVLKSNADVKRRQAANKKRKNKDDDSPEDETES